jgi:hypothetical protein
MSALNSDYGFSLQSKGEAKMHPALLGCAAVIVLCAIIVTVGCGSSSNTTSSNMTVAQNTISKGLWIANGTNVVEFIPSQLMAGSSDPAPHLSNNSGVFGAPQGVTFDSNGDLWVIDGGTVSAGGSAPPALYEFTPAQLAALGTNNAPAPNVTIKSGSFTFPQQAVFDGKGNLWVSDNMSNAVFEFTPAQLTASATLTPNVSITSTPAFNGPLGIVFDASGDLWIANNGTTTIFEFTASTLPTAPGSVSLTPTVILSDDGSGSIQAPWALVFDSKGDLWSSNANAPFTVVEFAPGSLTTTGSPTPAITLSPTTVDGNSTLAAPNGIAFDNLGDLAAISSATPFGVALFGQPQLTAGGAVVPTSPLVGNTTTLNAPAGCNFGPLVN